MVVLERKQQKDMDTFSVKTSKYAKKYLGLREDFQLFDSVEVINRQPIACAYKGVKLLGDKLDLYISNNQIAQELAYFALGTGILEMNPRGYGFVNDKWSK